MSDPSAEPRGSGALVARICQACVRALPVSGAAVSLMTPAGHRGVVAATDDRARRLEDVQFTAGEGPGVDAFTIGRPVLVPHLELEEVLTPGEWTVFRDTARDLGVRAVFAFPLRLGVGSLGSLTAYHDEPTAVAGTELAKAMQLSDAAAVALLDLMVEMAMDGHRGAGAELTEQPELELYRAEIYQAAGMVMVQLEVSIEVALVRLRSHAYATGRPIADVARDIVMRKIRLEADNE